MSLRSAFLLKEGRDGDGNFDENTLGQWEDFCEFLTSLGYSVRSYICIFLKKKPKRRERAREREGGGEGGKENGRGRI